jgi:hypothetical protein
VSDEPLQPHERNHDLQDMNGLPQIDHVNLTGPFNPSGPGDTPSRRRIFACRPAAGVDENACARRVLTTLARRAYRRPVTADDMAPVMDQYEAGPEGRLVRRRHRARAAPHPRQPEVPVPRRARGGQAGPVSDLELASRLSFFLWSSIPDDALIDAAVTGRLRTPAGWSVRSRACWRPEGACAHRQLRQPVAAAAQPEEPRPTPGDFPNFDNELRQAFRQETELFFNSVVRDDRSVLDLINANYTYVNERLARHYGIPNVYGSNFRRVPVTNEARRGLLGQGSVLTGDVVSEPHVAGAAWQIHPGEHPRHAAAGAAGQRAGTVGQRSRPGAEVAARADGAAPQDAVVRHLPPGDGSARVRAREFRRHRGLASEGTGRRHRPAGKLADGSDVDGPVALRAAIMRHPDQFVRTLTEKLMTYGLGRGLEYYDMPVVRAIARDAAKKNYRFSAIVAGIVSSSPFRQKAPQAAATQLASADR